MARGVAVSELPRALLDARFLRQAPKSPLKLDLRNSPGVKAEVGSLEKGPFRWGRLGMIFQNQPYLPRRARTEIPWHFTPRGQHLDILGHIFHHSFPLSSQMRFTENTGNLLIG